MSVSVVARGFIYLMAAVLTAATIVPLSTSDHWAIRVMDFPRKQVATALLATIAATASVIGPGGGQAAAGLLVLSGCFLYQLDHVIQYTPLTPPEVEAAVSPSQKTRTISLLTANVEVSNRDSQAFCKLAREEDPDLILAIETDSWWADQLQELTDTWEHTAFHPREDPYGMCLLSKRPIKSAEICQLADSRTPAIRATLPLTKGACSGPMESGEPMEEGGSPGSPVPDTDVTLWGVHPRPPHPVHETDTTFRDAELIVLGRRVRDEEGPVIVSGDLNDVSWSHTTDLFQRIGGMLDPRRGRGFYNTFHARYPVLRYPLDHTFCSPHFRVRRLEVLPFIGSDHYPVATELQYDPEAEAVHDAPKKCRLTGEWADREMAKLRRKLDDPETGEPGPLAADHLHRGGEGGGAPSRRV